MEELLAKVERKPESDRSPIYAHLAIRSKQKSSELLKFSENFKDENGDYYPSLVHRAYWYFRCRPKTPISDLIKWKGALNKRSFAGKGAENKGKSAHKGKSAIELEDEAAFLNVLEKISDGGKRSIYNKEFPELDELMDIFYYAMEGFTEGYKYRYILLYWTAGKLERSQPRLASILYKSITESTLNQSAPTELSDCAFAALIALCTKCSAARGLASMCIYFWAKACRESYQLLSGHIDFYISNLKGITADSTHPKKLEEQLLTVALKFDKPAPEAIIEYAKRFSKRSRQDRKGIARLLYRACATKSKVYDESNASAREKFEATLFRMYKHCDDEPHIDYNLARMYITKNEPENAFKIITPIKDKLDIPVKVYLKLADRLSAKSLYLKRQGKKPKQRNRLNRYLQVILTKASDIGSVDACDRQVDIFKRNRYPYTAIEYLAKALKIAYMKCDVPKNTRPQDIYEERVLKIKTFFKSKRLTIHFDPINRLDDIRAELFYPLGRTVSTNDIYQAILKTNNLQNQIENVIQLSRNSRSSDLEQSVTQLVTYYGCLQHIKVICDANGITFDKYCLDKLNPLVQDDVHANVYYKSKNFMSKLRYLISDQNNLLAIAAHLDLDPNRNTAEHQRLLVNGINQTLLHHYFNLANKKDFLETIVLFDQLNKNAVKAHISKKLQVQIEIYRNLLLIHPNRLSQLNSSHLKQQRKEQVKTILKKHYQDNCDIFNETTSFLRKWFLLENLQTKMMQTHS